MPADWSLLTKELQQWAAAGKEPLLWLRDDDAIAPSAALERLLSLCDRYQVPAVLAVIPEPSGAELASRLKDAEQVRIAVHGWRHENHARAGEKKQELGHHRPHPEIVTELERGFAKLKVLHAERFLPMLVPPWNRIDSGLLSALPAIGFRAVSSYGDALLDGARSGLAVVNTHLDIMDWSSRRGREHDALIVDFVAQLRRSRERDSHPVGILAHHRDHDEAAWSFLDELFKMTALAGAGRWLAGGSLPVAAASIKA